MHQVVDVEEEAEAEVEVEVEAEVEHKLRILKIRIFEELQVVIVKQDIVVDYQLIMDQGVVQR